MRAPGTGQEPVDLLVVGGSFAGLVCARRAAELGLRVVVLERKPDPGARVHTTGIAVREAMDEIALPPALVREIPGVRVYTPNLRQIDLNSPGYRFFATDTPEVMRWLAGQATAAGAQLLLGTAFRGAEFSDGLWRLEGLDVRARYLVGADGARSMVARALGLGRNTRHLVGVEAEFAGIEGLAQDRLHCFVNSHWAPGYIAWAVPGVGVTQVGLACRHGHKPALGPLVEALAGLADFRNARVVGRRSGIIPVGGPVQPIHAPGVCLVGDAAGMVSPLTAGGIHPAFRQGRHLAELVAAHLDDPAAVPDPGLALAAGAPRYRWKGLMRRMFDLDPPNWLYNLTLGLAPTRAFSRLVYFHHKGFASRAAWRELFRR